MSGARPGPVLRRVGSLLRQALDPVGAAAGRAAAAARLASLGAAEIDELGADSRFGQVLELLESATAAAPGADDEADDDEPPHLYGVGSDLRGLLNDAYAQEQVQPPLLPAATPLTARARACARAPLVQTFDSPAAAAVASSRLERVSALLLLSQRSSGDPSVLRAYLDVALSRDASLICMPRPLAQAVEEAVALRPATQAWVDGLARWLDAYLALALMHPGAPEASTCDWQALHLVLLVGVARRAQAAEMLQPSVVALGDLLAAVAVLGAASTLDLRHICSAAEGDLGRAVELIRARELEEEKSLFEAAISGVLARPSGADLARLASADRAALIWSARVVAHDPRLASVGLLALAGADE